MIVFPIPERREGGDGRLKTEDRKPEKEKKRRVQTPKLCHQSAGPWWNTLDSEDMAFFTANTRSERDGN